MKKIFKKIKLKYLARSLLVVIVLVYGTLICSAAASSTTVTLSNPNNILYDYDYINYYTVVPDGTSDFQSIFFGQSLNIDYINYNFPFIQVLDGDFYFGGEYYPAERKLNVSDGYYSLVFGFAVNNPDETYNDIYVSADGSIDSVIVGLGFFCGYFQFYESVPDELHLVLNDGESGGLGYITYILVPYIYSSENISSVWTHLLDWFISCINVVVGIFWTGTQLTLIGTLAFVGTLIALCLLIFYKVKDYLKLQ